MLNFFKKKVGGTQVIFNIQGMHCPSCAMNIDGQLEDTKGVLSASTSYATLKTQVRFDQKVVSQLVLKKIIEDLGYQVSLDEA